MTDIPYTNGRKDFQRILVAIIAACWSVILIAGSAWIASIQSQTNAGQVIDASQAVQLQDLRTSFTYLSRDNADLRIKVSELERTLISMQSGRAGGH